MRMSRHFLCRLGAGEQTGARCDHIATTRPRSAPDQRSRLRTEPLVRGGAASGNRTPDLLITRGLIPSSDRYQQLGLYVGACGTLRLVWSATVGEHIGEHIGEPTVHSV